MLVYGSPSIGGMGFLGYDNGFHHSLSFFWMPWYVGMFISVLEIWNCWMDFRKAEVVTRFVPKGLGNP